MQYSSFIGDHIPCRYKSLIEDSSLRQLLFVTEDRQKIRPEFIAEFRNKATPKGKGNASADEDAKGSAMKRRAGDDDPIGKPLSLQDVFVMVTRGGKFTRAFRGWKVCAQAHHKPILYGLPDDPAARARRSNSLYLSSLDNYNYSIPQFVTKSTRVMNLQAGTCAAVTPSRSSPPAGTFCGPFVKAATKVRSCHATGSPGTDARGTRSRYGAHPVQAHRPASSSLPQDHQRRAKNEGGVRSASSSEQNAVVDDAAIDVEFQHVDNVDSYAASYREGYTYRKLQEQHSRCSSTSTPASSNVSLSPSQQTRAHLICIDGAPPGIQSAPAGPRQSTASARDTRDHRGNNHPHAVKCKGCEEGSEEKIPMRWQMNQRFRDLCDPRLTVNCPSPTEVAVLCRIPPAQTVHKSSPSIPSNTNGKFGGKSTDKPYPFQLHISAASCPVEAPAKKASKSVFGFL